MTENNTPENVIISTVTTPDLMVHRSNLVQQKNEAYSLYLQTQAPDDAPHHLRTTQLQMLIDAWDNMNDYEKAEVIRDERTKTATPADSENTDPIILTEATEATRLTDEATALISERQGDRQLHGYLDRVTTALIASELGNEQKTSEVSRLAQRVSDLSEQITDGSDPRLTDFWELAEQKADRAGFCEQYDIIAEALGGPTRTVSYNVEHTLTVSVQVTAYSYQSAGRNATSGDFEGYEDAGYDDDIEDRIKEAIENGNYTIESSNIEQFEESD